MHDCVDHSRDAEIGGDHSVDLLVDRPRRDCRSPHPTLCPRAVAGNGSVGGYLIFRRVSVILPRQRTRSHDRRAVHHSLYRGVCFCRITRPTFGIATTTIGVKF